MSTSNSRRLALAAAALALLVGACSDPFKMKASYSNMPFVYSLYALSGKGPSNAPSALELQTQSAVRVDGNFAFDVAFDFDNAGKIKIIPQKLVGTPVAGSRTMMIQRLTTSFNSVDAAPTKGYMQDSIVTIVPGETVIIRLTSSGCVYQLSSEMYAKLTVDSVKAGGLIFGRGVMNPNCGFRSFGTGVPSF